MIFSTNPTLRHDSQHSIVHNFQFSEEITSCNFYDMMLALFVVRLNIIGGKVVPDGHERLRLWLDPLSESRTCTSRHMAAHILFRSRPQLNTRSTFEDSKAFPERIKILYCEYLVALQTRHAYDF